MNTNQLIKEILSHPELHDLITHLGDFQEGLIEKRDSVLEDMGDGDTEVSYWDKQIGVVEKLIKLTEGY